MMRLSLTAVDTNQLLEGDGFGLVKFGRTVKDAVDAFSFSVWTGLINPMAQARCNCGAPMSLGVRQGRVDTDNQGLRWDCTSPHCRMKISITVDTWFEGIHIRMLTALELALYWYYQVPVTSAAGQCGVSKECAIDWYNFCREVAFTIVDQMDLCIGGVNLTVEIDETHLWRRKYGRGRRLAFEDVWVFGGICRETKEAFIQLVPNRTGATLWPIIARRIAPGSTIMSDQAAVYTNLHQPNRGGFNHHQINHSIHFVDPNDRSLHTNTVERTWGLLKGMVKGFCDGEHLEMYLGEFIYRRHFLLRQTDRDRRHTGETFRTFLHHIAEIYPGPFL